MRYARFVVPVALAVALLTGCGPKTATPSASPSAAPTGIAALSPQGVVQQAVAALKKAGSYRMKGDMSSGGMKAAVDVKVQGANSLIAIATNTEGSMMLLTFDGVTYLQADEAFWKQAAGADTKTYNAKFKGKWIKTPEQDPDMGKFRSLTDPEKVFDPAETQGLKMDVAMTLNGKPAFRLKDATNGALYVATEGEPYPLRMESGELTLDFSDFGAKFDDIKAPAAGTIVTA